jgi:hypothetical protein
MSWRIHDEFIDLAQARHVVIFRNDVGAEHQLLHEFMLPSCPHCGEPKLGIVGTPLDFEKTKADTLAALNDHYRRVMNYREKHARVEVRSRPR